MTIENTKTKDFPSLLFVSNAESLLFVCCSRKIDTYAKFNDVLSTKSGVASSLVWCICLCCVFVCLLLVVAVVLYLRYCPGVTPNLFLNTMLNCAKLEYPTALAISIVFRSVLISKFCAYSNLLDSK